MHRFVAIVLLLLVPLRVFSAEAVGLCMLQAAQVQAQSAGAMPDDCPMMQHAPSSPTKPSNHSGSGCESCELCMPLAGPDGTPATSGAGPAASIDVISFVPFRSAEIPRALKPPIG